MTYSEQPRHFKHEETREQRAAISTSSNLQHITQFLPSHSPTEQLDVWSASSASLRPALAHASAAERWLAGNYLSRLTSANTVVFKASITHITSSGFTVRLLDNGLTGFVDLRKDPEKFSYDKWTASLTSTTRRFQLNQEVELSFLGIDEEVQNQSLFKPVVGCGLKQETDKG